MSYILLYHVISVIYAVYTIKFGSYYHVCLLPCDTETKHQVHRDTEGWSATPNSLPEKLPSVLDLLLEPNEKEHTSPCWIYPDELALRGQAALYLQTAEALEKFSETNRSHTNQLRICWRFELLKL